MQLYRLDRHILAEKGGNDDKLSFVCLLCVYMVFILCLYSLDVICLMCMFVCFVIVCSLFPSCVIRINV